MPRLSRETPRRQFDPGCPQASADLYEGLQIVTPVTQSLLLFHASSSSSCCCCSCCCCCFADERREEDEREEEADGDGRVPTKTKTPQHNAGKKKRVSTLSMTTYRDTLTQGFLLLLRQCWHLFFLLRPTRACNFWAVPPPSCIQKKGAISSQPWRRQSYERFWLLFKEKNRPRVR